MALICIEFVFQKIQSQIQIKNLFTDQDFAWSVISWTVQDMDWQNEIRIRPDKPNNQPQF